MEGMSQLKQNQAQIMAKKAKSKAMVPVMGMGPRKAGLAGISLGLLWMGIYRLFG